MSDHPAYTEDALLDGRLVVRQHARGYRHGLDAVLLATDLPPLPKGSCTVVELGAAHGPVALLVAALHPQACVFAVERQPALFALLAHNAAQNAHTLGGEGGVRPVLWDLRERPAPAPIGSHMADLVVCNPPYFPPRQRRPSACLERAEARHELHGTIGDFVQSAAWILKQRGWLKLIAPPLRMWDVLEAARRTDLALVSLRFVHANPQSPAYLVEYVLRRGGAGDLVVRPPLHVREAGGEYAQEVQGRLVGRASLEP